MSSIHDTRLLLLSQEYKTQRKKCIYICFKNTMPYFFFCTNQRSQSQDYIQGLQKKRKTTKEHTWKTLLSN